MTAAPGVSTLPRERPCGDDLGSVFGAGDGAKRAQETAQRAAKEA
jgi:hypothetical protein